MAIGISSISFFLIFFLRFTCYSFSFFHSLLRTFYFFFLSFFYVLSIPYITFHYILGVVFKHPLVEIGFFFWRIAKSTLIFYSITLFFYLFCAYDEYIQQIHFYFYFLRFFNIHFNKTNVPKVPMHRVGIAFPISTHILSELWRR